MLSLKNYQVTELPKSIGDLQHLRYLNLSGTRIKSLPKSTSSLINLLILKLKDCNRLKKLPSNISNLIKLRYLDIRGVDLEEMPLGMNKLKCLRYLSDFIVGKNVGAGLKDLKNLENLCGEIWISRLENVDDLHELSETILKDKKEIKELMLKWNSKFDDTRNEVKEKKVLDMLRPHQNLEMIKIKFYGGIEFPSWVGDSSFSKLTVLTLERCESCTLLPSLRLLRSLKDLTIKGMNGLRKIGKEFCGQHCSTSFESLETLCFEDLQEWEHWEHIQENECGGAFSCLRKFSVMDCPKLCGSLPSCLPSLEEFVIQNCNQLVVSFSSLPMLCNLKIVGCREVACVSPVDFKSLKSITLSHISEFGNWLRHDYFQKVEHLDVRDMSSEQLTSFWQKNGTFLERPQQGMQSFISIINLEITSCSELVSFPEVCFFSNLRSLKMEACSSLRFIVNGQLPSSLKRLDVRYCEKLEYLWDDREVSCTSLVDEENSSNTSTSLLEYLRVSNCMSLTSLSLSGQLPTTLSTLSIGGVPELESIAESFDDNRSLEEIHLWSCKKLKTISKSLHNLSGLRAIYIIECQNIVNLAEDRLPNDNLSLLYISWCGKLEGLPKGFHSLNSLKSLTLDPCPRMRSFPEEGFPMNITSLEIYVEVEFYKRLLAWGLHKLTSLRYLHIWGHPEVESFPEQEMGMKLPSSLTHLDIYKFPNFKWLLSQGFRNLNSLERLIIYDCPDQTSFPKLDLPSSLQSLEIQHCPDLTSISALALPSSFQSLGILNCPDLTSISELGLPSSLLRLDIRNCPMLKEGCKRNKGKEWAKISHIPLVKIDDIFIYDT